MAAVVERPDSRPATAVPRRSLRHGLPLRLAISGFVVFHILATLLWLLPNSAVRQQVQALPQKYISYVGLWQAWDLFAPNPASINLYLSAVVTYRDGSQREWVWPRMEQLDLLTRYREERYRKFVEYGNLDAYSGLWPSMAMFAVEQIKYRDPVNPPVRVQLWRHWWFVPPPPANGDISHDLPHEWHQYLFFDTPLPVQAVQP
ncbi:MAG TPA: hypothetical protein VIU62_11010 [Chloroflexota bacterium]